MEIDLERGQISCDLSMVGLPAFEDFALGLNRGLNIRDLKLNGISIDYNIDWGFPGRTAFLSDGIGIVPDADTLDPSSVLHLSYTGAFPVYGREEMTAAGDGMGVIAIKNGILRATHQALWYPVLVDRSSNFTMTKFQYDIQVQCKGCSSLYLAGSDPVKGSKARFVSALPSDLMLFAGDFDFFASGNTFFLNSRLSRKQGKIIDAALDSIRRFYSEILDQEFKQPLVLAQIFSIGPKSQYENWAFVVYPFIAAALNDLPKQIDPESGRFSDIQAFRLYSHELAHQFFGLRVKADNSYWGFYSESFAEYLALKAMEHAFDRRTFRDFLEIRYLHPNALSRTYQRLDQIEKDPDNLHKYAYFPMLLIGLEQQVGWNKMANFLRHLVQTASSTDLDFNFFRQKALESGISLEEWAAYEQTCIQTGNCLPWLKEQLDLSN